MAGEGEKGQRVAPTKEAHIYARLCWAQGTGDGAWTFIHSLTAEFCRVCDQPFSFRPCTCSLREVIPFSDKRVTVAIQAQASRVVCSTIEHVTSVLAGGGIPRNDCVEWWTWITSNRIGWYSACDRFNNSFRTDFWLSSLITVSSRSRPVQDQFPRPSGSR